MKKEKPLTKKQAKVHNTTEICMALVRGYCIGKNKKKVIDPDLINAMADEVLKILKNLK